MPGQAGKKTPSEAVAPRFFEVPLPKVRAPRTWTGPVPMTITEELDGRLAAPLPPTRSTARRPGRPARGGSEQLTEDILAVAEQLFLQQGFLQTSMDAIAARSGSSKRTLYARFPSKANLFEAVLRRHSRQRLTAYDRFLDSSEPAAEILHAVATELLADALDPVAIAYHRLFVSEAQRFPEIAAFGEERFIRPTVEVIATIIAGCATRGEISDEDPVFLAEQFLEIVAGRAIRRAACNIASVVPDSRAERSVALFLKGCRPRASAD